MFENKFKSKGIDYKKHRIYIRINLLEEKVRVASTIKGFATTEIKETHNLKFQNYDEIEKFKLSETFNPYKLYTHKHIVKEKEKTGLFSKSVTKDEIIELVEEVIQSSKDCVDDSISFKQEEDVIEENDSWKEYTSEV